ncbi:3-hydroxyacyl-CoA dehydrogenase-like protein [Xylogone sp. PMI_703]|nr:3-hydroxyacyl-CoA dehydrogenase-like protein [Xylogone sp. PMI_703]
MVNWQSLAINSRPLAILGAGVLGRRIAASWVAGGYNVVIRDLSEEQLKAAALFIDNNVSSFAQILKTSNRRPGNYKVTSNLVEAVSDAWFVIEAIPEKLDLKITTFEELSRSAPHDCILGSNSSSYKSSLMVKSIADDAKHRSLNVHYTMPPGNRIVELMTSTYTDEGVFQVLVERHKDIGLLPVIARKESTGFIINRLWAAVKRETLNILAEGVSDPEELDSLWVSKTAPRYNPKPLNYLELNGIENKQMEMFGKTNMGPCAMMDAVGLDTVASIEDNYIRERHLDGTNTVDFLRANYISNGKLGAKSGKGGLYPPGHTTKVQTDGIDHHSNLAAPTLYVLDIGLGEDSAMFTNLKDMIQAGSIWIVSADGQNMRKFMSGLEAPDGIDISLSSGRIFWTNMGIPSQNDGHIQSAELDGSDVREIIKKGEVHTPKQLSIDHVNKKLYFSDREGMRVHRSNFDGSDHEILVQTGDHNVLQDKEDETKWCVGVCVDPLHGKFYWSQKGPSKSGRGRIFRAAIATPAGEDASTRSDTELILKNLPEPIDLDIDAENEILYWTDRGEFPLGNTLNRANVSTAALQGNKEVKPEILSRHLHEAIGLRLDKTNKHIYFTDLGGAIYRTDMEGKNKEKICDTGSAFTGLALAYT